MEYSFSNFAYVYGFLFSDPKNFNIGQIEYLLTYGFEKVYIWKPNEKPSIGCLSLLIDVDPQVNFVENWKPFGRCLQIAGAFDDKFEHTDRFFYHWINNFDSKKNYFEEIFNQNEFSLSYGQNIRNLKFFNRFSSFLSLLLSDDSFYVACQNLFSSFETHSFCLTCEFEQTEHKMHSNCEPELWELSSFFPSMEIGLLQATRAVEGIVGKPGNPKRKISLSRVKERFLKVLGLDPEIEFKLAGKSYLDFYYDLFLDRGFAAHSFGKLSFNLKRKVTIQSQCFAWDIIVKYFKKYSLTPDDASNSLQYNYSILKDE